MLEGHPPSQQEQESQRAFLAAKQREERLEKVSGIVCALMCVVAIYFGIMIAGGMQ
jgi:cytoskeletal protein RodZ